MVVYIETIPGLDALIQNTHKNLLVVDFTASWCGPCRKIAPIYEQCAQDYPRITFVKVDVDKAQGVASKCGIRSMPTFHFYKNGELVDKLSGANASELKRLLEVHGDVSQQPKSEAQCCDHAHAHHDDSSKPSSSCCEPPATLSVPKDVLLEFFRTATDALKNMEHDENDNACAAKIMTLEDHKHGIMSTQLQALQEIVNKHEQKHDGIITAENIQTSLRQVAAVKDPELDAASDKFNEAARVSFAKSVLLAEKRFREYSNNTDAEDIPLRELVNENNYDLKSMRSALIEFFGLCNAAVQLPEVHAHLRSKAEPTPDDLIPPIIDGLKETSLPEAQKRLIMLQRTCLTAVGYDPSFATGVMNKIVHNYGQNDAELFQVFREFLNVMTTTLTDATAVDLKDDATGTRVTAVKYSEKTVSEVEAPLSDTMDQQKELEQRKQLQVARKAAALQQTIMAELIEMDEEDRAEALEEAKEAHDLFMKQMMEIPVGPERVAFLQNADDDVQRKLIMLKMWEALKAKNGGEEPKIVYAKKD
eukprot:CAMPEP_0196819102 /NCGR_PEP_ID=MMETSP1362-20130617/69049_1 /TAXON_ID=163516 /ORGANISM="Leptocylindrus danicus, Strain CCMP1856" /LENGTH=532 /DNA_ID=CAMNT_0042197461 /DNA_START=53 /DNA_END=1651 /DNA_ORIENTATION=-